MLLNKHSSPVLKIRSTFDITCIQPRITLLPVYSFHLGEQCRSMLKSQFLNLKVHIPLTWKKKLSHLLLWFSLEFPGTRLLFFLTLGRSILLIGRSMITFLLHIAPSQFGTSLCCNQKFKDDLVSPLWNQWDLTVELSFLCNWCLLFEYSNSGIWIILAQDLHSSILHSHELFFISARSNADNLAFLFVSCCKIRVQIVLPTECLCVSKPSCLTSKNTHETDSHQNVC